MTKIQSSYKVIKKVNIKNQEQGPVISTKLKSSFNDDFLAEGNKSKQIITSSIDEEALRQDIQSQLTRENEVERARIIKNTMEEAEIIKAQAHKNGHEQGLKDGYDQGYKKGYNEGLEEAEKQSIEIKNNALSLIDQAEKYVDQYFKENKARLISLAADMAESIIHSKIDTSAEDILMIINPILQQYGKKGNITITCHPSNIHNLKEKIHQLEENYRESKFILFEDGNLEKNGCVIENKSQIIDLQIRQQLDSIIKDIKEI